MLTSSPTCCGCPCSKLYRGLGWIPSEQESDSAARIAEYEQRLEMIRMRAAELARMVKAGAEMRFPEDPGLQWIWENPYLDETARLQAIYAVQIERRQRRRDVCEPEGNGSRDVAG